MGDTSVLRDVAFSCDDNGVPFLKVSVWSLLAHYKGAVPIRVNVFEGWGGHSAEHKAELAEIVGRFPLATLRYVNVEAAVAPYADVIMNREKSRWNVFTWTPIFTPQLLPDATGNVIHFDIDMLFNADVSELFDLPLNQTPQTPQTSQTFLIACTYEYDKYGDNAGKVIWEKGILPPSVERYFNTGVLVFNAAACRAERTWEKIVGWYKAHYDIADRIEQDAWNALYHDRMLPLHVKWNFHDRAIKNYAKWNLADRYWLGNPPRDCLEAAIAPSLLHFWGPKKPWKTSHRPYRKLYHAAMRAVGQAVPKEPPFAWWHNLRNRQLKRRVHYRLFDLNVPGWRKARRRDLRKRLARGLMVPFEWLGIGLAVALFAWLPRRCMQALCDVASAVMYAFDARGKRRAIEMLHVVLGRASGTEGTPQFDVDKAPYAPTRQEALIIRRSYRNMARTVGHAIWTCFRSVARVRASGIMGASAKAFLAANKPAVTVSAHVGCWEILSQLAYLEGHRMMSVAKRIGTPRMTDLLVRSRRSIGQEIVLSDGAFRSLMQGLHDGKSLGLLVDQRVDPDEGGIWVRFFGRPVPVSAAPAFFAAKGKASIIVAWARPLKDGRYRCEQLATIPAAEAKDIWGTTQRIADELAVLIRRHPSCWVLNYNLFSNQPTEKDLRQLAEREAKASEA